jgi:hypothetical protein
VCVCERERECKNAKKKITKFCLVARASGATGGSLSLSYHLRTLSLLAVRGSQLYLAVGQHLQGKNTVCNEMSRKKRKGC